jgi:hypothetical protein
MGHMAEAGGECLLSPCLRRSLTDALRRTKSSLPYAPHHDKTLSPAMADTLADLAADSPDSSFPSWSTKDTPDDS